MSEDVSAAVRMGMTFVILAQLVLVVVGISQMCMNVYNEYIEKYSVALSNPVNESILALNNLKSVGAPTVYKLLSTYVGECKVEITYLNGTVTSDYNTLLQNASSNVDTYVELRLNEYWVKIKEVK